MNRCSMSSGPLSVGISEQDILSVVAQLPVHHQAAIMLVDVEEFHCQEAADILGLPVQRVTKLLEQARRLIEKKLETKPTFNDLGHGPKIASLIWNSDAKNRLRKAVDSIPLPANLRASILARILSECRGPCASPPKVHYWRCAEKLTIVFLVMLFNIADATVLESDIWEAGTKGEGAGEL